MKNDSLSTLVCTLNKADVRYLIAGGLAVVAHGYLRSTIDVDLVISLDKENVENAFEALASKNLRYRPMLPISVSQFAKPDIRQSWVENRNMVVLNFISDIHREMPVDVFVDVPFDFEQEWGNALHGEIAPGALARFVSLETLLAMKKAAGRPRDEDDIQHLTSLRNERGYE